MVLKKKKKKGSKKKKKSPKSKSVGPDTDDIDGQENADPSTLISGPEAAGTKGTMGGKKKKVKKKKLTKAERAQEKLEKAMDKIRKEPDIFNNFVDRMDRWLRKIAPQAIALFKKMDSQGDGILSYDLFKSGMFDMNVPLNKIELHLLATLLDTENSGEIDYTELADGLQHVRERDELDGEEEEEDGDMETDPRLMLILTERKLNTCHCCKMAIDGPYKEKNPLYLQIELRLVTFDKFKKHPGHINLLVHSHLQVFGLVQLIVELTKVQSTKISVFRDKTRTREVRLTPEKTLQECGYKGDAKESPEEIVLYYDYTVEFTDCPILVCDHYFGQNVKAM